MSDGLQLLPTFDTTVADVIQPSLHIYSTPYLHIQDICLASKKGTPQRLHHA